MNAPVIPRAILRRHAATIEARFPPKVLGLLPQGSAGHVRDPDGLAFLAEKSGSLNLLDLCDAELALSDVVGRPVGIVLVSGLQGREAGGPPRRVEAL
ncbi:MAG TPA: hypothetical protein VEA41_19830 [Salinarimonas sp.]|nr:hypothetical protein [Salinarimonas sp.]